jgi:hypothetical protein
MTFAERVIVVEGPNAYEVHVDAVTLIPFRRMRQNVNYRT